MIETSAEQRQTQASYRLLLGDLWRLLALAPPRLRRTLGLAVLFTVLATLADIGSLALLQKALRGGSAALAAGSVSTFAGFAVAAMIGSGCRLAALRLTVAGQYGMASELTAAAFTRLQHQDYSEYLRHGASQGIAAFERLQMLAFQALVPMIAGFAAVISMNLLLAGMVFVAPEAGLAFVLLSLLTIALPIGTRASRSRKMSGLASMRARLIHEARVGFRDIFLTNGQERMIEDFTAAEHDLRTRQASAVVAAQSVRHTLELAALGVALAGLLLLPWLGARGSGAQAIPFLGVLAFGGLRLLPHLAAMRSALRTVVTHGQVTRDVLTLLAPEQAQPEAPAVLASCREVRLDGVTVQREGRPASLRAVSLTIPRGARIGIMGASGTGKSTLLDVLAGALQPSEGAVLVDGQPLGAERGRGWRERIGMVSQNPVLLGHTLREAVSFPERADAADPARFAAAIEISGVAAMVAEFDHGLDTPVGEAIEHLSGGQRQRLALAHALYRAQDLLLLDEASGQLDGASEDALIAALRALPAELSVVLVSHRPALFAVCDTVYALDDGTLREVPAAAAGGAISP